MYDQGLIPASGTTIFYSQRSVSESCRAVERLYSSQGLSVEAMERINDASSALGTIEQSVEHIHDQVTKIAAAAEQRQVAKEINKNLVRMVDAAQKRDTAVTQTNEARQELACLGERLRELVTRFQV